jgi:lipopolysaccharide export system protein LptA
MRSERKPVAAIGLVLLLSIAATFPLQAQQGQSISFKGGYTKAVMKEGRQSIVLSGGAIVATGSITFEAETIELTGADFNQVSATGAVKINDSVARLAIQGSNLRYDRLSKTLILDGWIEIQDFKNEVIASGAYLSYDEPSGLLMLQIEARLARHTESGPMVCRADSIVYDRSAMKLALVGNSSVYWKGDRYEASTITVDLETEEIVLEGTIRGTVNG